MLKKYFIGEWNLSVLITYIGLSSAVIGMAFAFRGNINYSLICLIVSGICDLLDGPFARKFKRNEMEKLFGIQIDSLVDVVSFLCLPIVIVLSLVENMFSIVVCIIYCICGVARLAFFNVHSEIDVVKEFYRGLPVTYISFILPLWYIFSVIQGVNSNLVLIVLGLTSLYFVLNVPVKKPMKDSYPIFIGIAMVATYFLKSVIAYDTL